MLLGLLGLVGAAFLLERGLSLDDPVSLPPALVMLLAALPSLVWLGYFYSQDRHEVNPKPFVLGVFVLGALVSGPCADFLVQRVTSAHAAAVPSLRPFSPERLVAAFAIVGIAQELSKYLVVRYTLYRSPAFDQPIDGILYMTAAGLGFATYENVQYLEGLQGQVYLGTGVAAVVVTTLAHAAFAGVLGLALGRAKFQASSNNRRAGMLFVGLLGAAALNGQYVVVMDIVSSDGLELMTWRGVTYTFGFAAAVFLVLSVFSRSIGHARRPTEVP